MSIQQTQIIDILKTTFVPQEKKPLLSIASIDGIEVNDNNVNIYLSLFKLEEDTLKKIEDIIKNRVKQLGANTVNVEFKIKELPKIKFTIAIGSGKGGVGKSTVTTNIAVALSNLGKRVGILDADLYGPNIPLMFGVNSIPTVSESHKLVPLENYGVKLISLGFLLEDPATPVIWRGPLITKAVEQLYYDVDWGELDFLLIDLPPGTGDISLTIAQSIPTKFGIIVTTPQDVSVLDATKALSMFQKLNIEVIGVIENMSYFVCPNCGSKYSIFGSGGGEKIAEKFSVPLLAKLPLELEIREGGDTGLPIFVLGPELISKEIYRNIAENIVKRLTDGNGA